MAYHAFLRLIWRPAFALLLPMSGAFLLAVFVMTLNWDLALSRQLMLSMIAMPFILGMLVGQTVHDVRTRHFAWTLPGLHRKLALSVFTVGVLCAAAWATAYRNLGGEIAGYAGFGGFLFAYMGFAALQPSGLLAWLLTLAAVVGATPLFEFIRTQPVVWTLVALSGATACFLRGFGPGAARRIVQSPHALMGVNLFNQLEIARAQRELLKRSVRARDWSVSRLGQDLWGWARAIEHARLGAATRLRTGVMTIALFVFMGLCITSPAFMHQGRSFASGVDHAFHLLFTPSTTLEDPTFVPISLMVAIWAGSFVFSSSGMFQRGWIYPISRHQRGQVAFRMSLRQNLALFGLLTLTFAVYGGLIVYLRGGAGELNLVPRYFRSAFAACVLLPAVQRFHYWIDQSSTRDWSIQWTTLLVALGVGAFAGLAELATYLWSIGPARGGAAVQGLLLLILFAATQWLYRGSLVRHFQRSDLV